MTPKAAIQRACVVAHVTRKRFLTRMLHLVPQQATARGALVTAWVEIAHEWLLASMCAPVNAEVAAGGTTKTTPRLLTGKRFLARMRALVRAKVQAAVALVRTLVTRKPLLARVCPLVSAQVGALCKAQAACCFLGWHRQSKNCVRKEEK